MSFPLQGTEYNPARGRIPKPTVNASVGVKFYEIVTRSLEEQKRTFHMIASDTYRDDFYAKRHETTRIAARVVMETVLGIIPPVRSAVDFGCGVGTWLSILQDMGISDIVGVEGPWVARTHLRIPEKNLHTADFERDITLDRQFDLAISLEVAEHLSHRSAGRFVGELCKSADFVLFSAAIPCQGGTNHVNEQWPAWWAGQFAEHGFTGFDVLRRRFWNDDRIPYWYRQNMLLFARNGRSAELRLPPLEEQGSGMPMALVHPEQLKATIESLTTVRGVGRSLCGAVARAVSGCLGIRRNPR